MSLNRWSLRTKIIALGVALPTLLMVLLFLAYASHQKKMSVEAIVEKARSICLATESTRQGMEDYWTQGVFMIEQLKSWEDHGAAADEELSGQAESLSSTINELVLLVNGTHHEEPRPPRSHHNRNAAQRAFSEHKEMSNSRRSAKTEIPFDHGMHHF